MKAVLFDLYGTLIDIHTDEDSFLFWKKIAKKTKHYKEYDYLELKLNYSSLCKKYQNYKEEIDILDVFMELFNCKINDAKVIAILFRKMSTKYIKLYKEAKKLLIILKELNIPIYALSNAQNAFTIYELKKLKIFDLFDGIAISSDYGIKKPNKAFFSKAINDFKIQNYDLFMIGNDYECDIIPAKELGIKTIFISSNLTFKYQNKMDLEILDKTKIKNIILNN